MAIMRGAEGERPEVQQARQRFQETQDAQVLRAERGSGAAAGRGGRSLNASIVNAIMPWWLGQAIAAGAAPPRAERPCLCIGTVHPDEPVCAGPVAAAQAALPEFPRFMTAECAILGSLARPGGAGNHAAALSAIPRTLRLMYVHAFQSYLWNAAASHRMEMVGCAARPSTPAGVRDRSRLSRPPSSTTPGRTCPLLPSLWPPGPCPCPPSPTLY